MVTTGTPFSTLRVTLTAIVLELPRTLPSGPSAAPNCGTGVAPTNCEPPPAELAAPAVASDKVATAAMHIRRFIRNPFPGFNLFGKTRSRAKDFRGKPRMGLPPGSAEIES